MYLSVLILSVFIVLGDALECLFCNGVQNTNDCHITKTCSQSEFCFTEVDAFAKNVLFNLGCRSSSQCYGDTSVGSSLVGRAAISNSTCNQCCSVDYCNRDVCSHSGETVVGSGFCEDSSEFNCKLVSSTFNICADIHHAKTVCRKFCGLCDLVDGGWGAWGGWSMCEKSCGESQKVRIRVCDDPAPAHRGLDCVGDGIEFENCSLSPCPVAGGWSHWSDWAACSKSCGVGLQQRDRTCSNPYPDHGGDHCFGDSTEDRVCFSRPCANGGWSSWTTWGTCSASCNGGLKSRQRICNNPPPSLLGRQCVGNSIEYISCNNGLCQVLPSTQKVYFAVNTPTGHLYSDNSPVFSKIVINVGNDYDISTGQFTTSVPGIYQFFVTFVTRNSRTQCFIRKNKTVIVYALTSASSDWKSASASTYIHCDIGDIIDLSCGGWEYVDHNATSMFSGALVSAD